MFYDVTGTYIKYITGTVFNVGIKLKATVKSDQDPDPDPHWYGSLDPH